MASYNESLQSNNIDLRTILNTINSLPTGSNGGSSTNVSSIIANMKAKNENVGIFPNVTSYATGVSMEGE